MSCCSDAKKSVATCVCSGHTVFDHAVVGQVFTGDVQMRCPHAEAVRRMVHDSRRRRRAGTSLSSALLAIAVWDSTSTFSGSSPSGSAPLTQAGLLLGCGLLARYAPAARRLIANGWKARRAKRAGLSAAHKFKRCGEARRT